MPSTSPDLAKLWIGDLKEANPRVRTNAKKQNNGKKQKKRKNENKNKA
jgi:hypothetical protein